MPRPCRLLNWIIPSLVGLVGLGSGCAHRHVQVSYQPVVVETVTVVPAQSVYVADVGYPQGPQAVDDYAYIEGAVAVAGENPDLLGYESLSNGSRVDVVVYVHIYEQPVESYPQVSWSGRTYHNVNGTLVYFSPQFGRYCYYWGPPVGLVYAWNHHYPARRYAWGAGYYGDGWYWGGVGHHGHHAYAPRDAYPGRGSGWVAKGGPSGRPSAHAGGPSARPSARPGGPSGRPSAQPRPQPGGRGEIRADVRPPVTPKATQPGSSDRLAKKNMRPGQGPSRPGSTGRLTKKNTGPSRSSSTGRRTKKNTGPSRPGSPGSTGRLTKKNTGPSRPSSTGRLTKKNMGPSRPSSTGRLTKKNTRPSMVRANSPNSRTPKTSAARSSTASRAGAPRTSNRTVASRSSSRTVAARAPSRSVKPRTANRSGRSPARRGR